MKHSKSHPTPEAHRLHPGDSNASTFTGNVPAGASSTTKTSCYAMPIGINDFKELVTSISSNGHPFWLADKSSLISEITGSGAKISLITRPRRFGKTLNLSMLAYFFSVEDAQANRQLFEDLAVAQNPDPDEQKEGKQPKVMEHQGQYAVVSASFKTVGAQSFEEQLTAFIACMRKLYQQHYYLVDESTSKLTAEEKIYFRNVCAKKIDQADLASSFEQLIGFAAMLAWPAMVASSFADT